MRQEATGDGVGSTVEVAVRVVARRGGLPDRSIRATLSRSAVRWTRSPKLDQGTVGVSCMVKPHTLVGRPRQRYMPSEASRHSTPLGQLSPHQGDELATVVDGVLERGKTTNQEGGDTSVAVVEERFGDLFRGANQG